MAWEDNPSDDNESAIDVFMRVFDSGGDSLLGPVKVNTTDEQNQRFAKVAIAPDGTFLVIWQSYEGGRVGSMRKFAARLLILLVNRSSPSKC